MLFEIDEDRQDEWLVLRLTGELDLASAPVLQHRLAQLRADKQPVRLDLSGLQFIDSSGMRLLIAAFNEARSEGWRLDVLPSLSSNVEQSLRLAKLERIISGPHPN